MGLASGDDETGVASPYAVVPYGGLEDAAAVIGRALADLGADVVVLGLPTGADGEPTAACRRSYLLAERLRERGCRVELQAEYLTTNEARRRARAAGLRPDRPVDHLAAQVLLEEFLRKRGCGGA